MQRRWQQRLDRADTLLQQQTERAQTLAAGQDAAISQLRNQLESLNQTIRSLDDSLSALKTEKLSLSRQNEQLRDEKGLLQGEGQDLRGLIEVLRGSVRGLTQRAHQVGYCWSSFTMHMQSIMQTTHARCVEEVNQCVAGYSEGFDPNCPSGMESISSLQAFHSFSDAVNQAASLRQMLDAIRVLPSAQPA